MRGFVFIAAVQQQKFSEVDRGGWFGRRRGFFIRLGLGAAAAVIAGVAFLTFLPQIFGLFAPKLDLSQDLYSANRPVALTFVDAKGDVVGHRGAIVGQLAGPLGRSLASRPEPHPLLVLVDGDAFEAGNLNRQACTIGDLGTNKAEVLAQVAHAAGLASQAISSFIDETNVRSIVREGDLVLLAVDNHRARALVDRHLGALDDATLISGGNDETDGNVQLVRRRDGWSVDGHLTEVRPELREAADGQERRVVGCQVLAAESPQLLVTNLLVASAMLACLWQVLERGSVPYSEVYLDAVQCQARSRPWFRLEAGAQ